MQIAVLGMHRSGTSVLTRLLGFIGCHLGDDADFNPVRSDNPAGDWERTDVWALNEDVLSALKATWCRVAGFDPGRLDEAQRAGFETRAREIVGRLDTRQPWAIKDPRLCLTLPVWRPALATPVCLITHRDPLSVARSLKRRDGFPLAVGIALWEAHVLESLRHSRGLPRLGVAHRRLIDDPPSALRALRQELEAAGVAGLHDADDAEVRGFVDPALHHGPADPAEQAAYLSPAQQSLAAALENGSALSWDDVPRLSDGARDLIEGYFGLFEMRDRLQVDVSTMTADRDRQAAELRRLADSLRETRERLRESEARALRSEGLAKQSEARATGHQQRRRQAERETDEVIARGTELEKLIDLVLSSRRWRYGDRAGDLLGKVMLRPSQPPAAEHARRIVSSFKDVCRDISRRRAESTDD